MASYDVLGTRVDALTLNEGLAYAESLIDQSGSHYIALPYVEFVMRARNQRDVAMALTAADLRLPNGVALNWAIQYLYGGKHSLGRFLSTLFSIVLRPNSIHQLAPARFDSTNFTWELLQRAARQHQTVFLIGSPKHQTIEQTAKHLQQKIPGIAICGVWPGYLNKAAEIRLSQELKQLRPDVILVGIGFPRQEQLMQRLKTELDHGLMLGEGGSFDYELYGGSIKRAPGWMQKTGLEWFWRLILEPSRIGRQMAVPAFIWQVYKQGQTIRQG